MDYWNIAILVFPDLNHCIYPDLFQYK